MIMKQVEERYISFEASKMEGLSPDKFRFGKRVI